MGFESKLSPMDHDVVEKSEAETSEFMTCDSAVVEELKKSVSEQLLLQVPLENKEGTESFSTKCDPANNKGDVAEVTTSRGDILELSITTNGSDDDLSAGCQTPRESIFDPFAPGPEEAACAPKKKVIRGTEVISRRQLNFDTGDYPVKRLSFDWNDAEEEEQYLQVIRKMILDLFISDGPPDGQEGAETVLIGSSPKESFKTPVSKPLLTGIATTCPDAPLRPSLKMSKLSPSICRKIDFDAVSDSGSSVSSVPKEKN